MKKKKKRIAVWHNWAIEHTVDAVLVPTVAYFGHKVAPCTSKRPRLPRHRLCCRLGSQEGPVSRRRDPERGTVGSQWRLRTWRQCKVEAGNVDSGIKWLASESLLPTFLAPGLGHLSFRFSLKKWEDLLRESHSVRKKKKGIMLWSTKHSIQNLPSTQHSYGAATW